jgi:putative redox protein
MTRSLTAVWTGDQSATVTVGGLRLAIGEDAVLDDGSPAPLPTDVLLASVASCFAIAMAFVAGKRGLELPGLAVDVTAEYDGPRVSTIDIDVRSSADPQLVERLLEPARRLCWVTNTLRTPPQITVRRS